MIIEMGIVRLIRLMRDCLRNSEINVCGFLRGSYIEGRGTEELVASMVV